jgi:PAS domain S-box-containing protein
MNKKAGKNYFLKIMQICMTQDDWNTGGIRIMSNKPTYEDLEKRVKEFEQAESERKRTEEELEKRVISAIPLLDASVSISIEDLFNLQDLQRLQDDFAQATGVASIITHTDGRPITEPSNFCRLCSEIIRNTEVGRANCFLSDSLIGRACVEGPTLLPCLSGGLWDAGAGISVGGRHIGNWLIGQVRDETQSEESLRAYAREIGVDEETVAEAFREVPAMARKQFERIAQVLFTIASQLSTTAYQNVLQARLIIERKQAEEALQESERKYRELVELSPVGIFKTNSKGQTLFANPEMARIVGADLSEKAINNFNDLSKDLYLDPNRRYEFIEVMKVKGAVENFEFEARGLNGKLLWLSMNAGAREKLSDGTFIIDGFIRDITKSKQADEALRESRQEFAEIFSMSLDPICIADINTATFLKVNPAFTRILGYSEQELLSRPFLEFIHPDDVFPTITLIKERLQKGDAVINFINRYRCKDGTYRWLEWVSHPIPKPGIMLTHLGYPVLEAKDGVEALEIFKQHQDEIRCVLSDLTMPRMDGWETLAALRILSSDIPVILSSGYDEAHVMAGEHIERPNAFLGKPYQLKRLRDTINRVLAAPAGDNGQLKTTN